VNSEEIRAMVEGRFPDITTSVLRERRVMIQVAKERLLEVLEFLHVQGLTHATAITGVDLIGDNSFEILYHLYWGRNLITVRTRIPRDNPVIPTLSPIFPGVVTYERELQGMFGIRVEGIPDPRRILLADDWPQDVHPLRKDYVVT
jgi:NADH:ubiquinone oxidoreductase subunit C